MSANTDMRTAGLDDPADVAAATRLLDVLWPVDTPDDSLEMLATLSDELTSYSLSPERAHALIQAEWRAGEGPVWSDEQVRAAVAVAAERAGVEDGARAEQNQRALRHVADESEALDRARRKLTAKISAWQQRDAANDVDDDDDDEPRELDFEAVVPPIEWRVERIFENDSVNMLAAHPGSMKTWTLYSMALAMARGEPWLGEFPVKQCPVLLLDWEMGQHRVLRRMKKLAAGPIKGVYYKRNWGSLHDLAFWTKLHDFVITHDIGAVFYDSLSGGSGGEDENSTTFSLPLKYAGRIDGVTHVFIHHAKKGDSKSNEVARGSSAIQAATDTIYRFTDPQGSASTTLTCNMVLARAGEGEQEAEVTLRLSDRDGLQRVERAAPTSAASKLSDLEGLIRLHLRDGLMGGVEDLVRKLGVRHQEVSNCVRGMRARGEIRGKRPMVLDSIALRDQRIVAAIAENPGTIDTPTMLARVADVDAADVERLVQQKRVALLKDGDGRSYIVVAAKPGG